MSAMTFGEMRAAAAAQPGFTPIPIGTYNFKVESADLKPGKGGQQIATKVVIMDGPLAGKSTFNRLVPIKNDGDVNAMFFRQMAALGIGDDHPVWAQVDAVGLEQGIGILAGLTVGTMFIGEVNHQPWNDEIKDNIKSMKPYGSGGVVPIGAPTGAPVLPMGVPTAPVAPAAAPLAPAMAVPVAPVAPVPVPVPAAAPVAPAPVPAAQPTPAVAPPTVTPVVAAPLQAVPAIDPAHVVPAPVAPPAPDPVFDGLNQLPVQTVIGEVVPAVPAPFDALAALPVVPAPVAAVAPVAEAVAPAAPAPMPPPAPPAPVPAPVAPIAPPDDSPF